MRSPAPVRRPLAALLPCAFAFAMAAPALAAPPSSYRVTRSFELPTGSALFDALADGRLITLDGAEISVETSIGSGLFAAASDLPGFAPPFGPSFLRVNPSGTAAAVGSNADGYIDIFDPADPATSRRFAASDFDAAWIDDHRLAITNFNGVQVLDTRDDSLVTVISGVGGASAGIAFDASGRLFTGNGFDFVPGGSSTGTIRAFEAADWQSALAGGGAMDFEAEGIAVATVLSASSLGFDAFGNMLVGGGDFFGGSGDFGYAGMIDASAIAARLGDPAGVPMIDATSPGDVLRRFEAGMFGASVSASPSWAVNEATGEVYLRFSEFGGSSGTVYVLQIPAPASAAVVGVALLAGARQRRGVSG